MLSLSTKALELKKLLQKCNHIRITSHRNPDGDSIGSLLSFGAICKYFNKPYDIFIMDPVPSELLFVDKNKEIQNFDQSVKDDVLLNEQTDLVVFLDCGQGDRAGELINEILPHQKIINIDHHMSNPYFGDFNYVSDISSTCELIFHLCVELNVPFDKDLADSLYVGILTDTGCFQYDKTTSITLQTASQLVTYGVNPFEIYTQIYQNYPVSWITLLQKAFSNLELYENNRVALVSLSLEDLADSEFTETSMILPIIGSVKDIEIYIIFKEKEDSSIFASLRSKSDDLDVAKIASIFGGGGHKRAAGCRTQTLSMEEFKKEILKEIRNYL